MVYHPCRLGNQNHRWKSADEGLSGWSFFPHDDWWVAMGGVFLLFHVVSVSFL